MTIPTYVLYGERQGWPTPDRMHCESIAARSRLHDWHIRPHQHSGLFQILYLQQGTASVQLDGDEEEMTGEAILLVPQNHVHGFRFNHDSQGVVLTIADTLLQELTRETGPGPFGQPCRLRLGRAAAGPVHEARELRDLRESIDAFVREYHGTALHRHLLLESLLQTILLRLARCLVPAEAPGPRGSQEQAQFARFCELVETWYVQHHPLERYADALGMTTAALHQLCRRMAQRSPLALIHQRLLLEARRNIVYTSMTISELAYAIGFSDPAYFTRFFKRATGESPTAFRHRILQMRGDATGQDGAAAP